METILTESDLADDTRLDRSLSVFDKPQRDALGPCGPTTSRQAVNTFHHFSALGEDGYGVPLHKKRNPTNGSWWIVQFLSRNVPTSTTQEIPSTAVDGLFRFFLQTHRAAPKKSHQRQLVDGSDPS